jgi:hypothetical protein
MARVSPEKTRFDGVAGGALWLDGRIIADSPNLGTKPALQTALPLT